MERIPIEERIELHDTIAGLYNLLFADDIVPDEIELYEIESEYVEAEIELPSIGINRADWEEEWTPERRIEVLLHEFAHIEEDPDEPDHGPRFYDRLADLARIAETHQSEIETLFGTELDFERIHEHIIGSINEWTIEADIDTVEGRRQVVRKALFAADAAQ